MLRRGGRGIIAAGVALVLVALAIFVLRADEPAAAFTYRFQDGERRSYTLDMRVRIAPRTDSAAEAFTGRVRASMDVIAVERSGRSTVVDVVLDDVVTEPVRPGARVEPGTIRLTLAPDGRVTGVEGTGGLLSLAGVDPGALVGAAGGAAGGAGSQVLFPQFPTEQLEPGARWSRTTRVPVPFAGTSATVRFDGRFEGYADSPRGRAAWISTTMTTPIDVAATLADLARAAGATPGPDAAGSVAIDGRTVTQSRALVIPSTGELLELDGTTTLGADLHLDGVPGADARGYGFDATITMAIERDDR